MGFFRPEYWSEQLLPSPGALPNPGIKPRSPALQVDSLLAEPQGKPLPHYTFLLFFHLFSSNFLTICPGYLSLFSKLYVLILIHCFLLKWKSRCTFQRISLDIIFQVHP